ncbi:MAG TPA: hypothetical protein VFP98_09655 [Candidatus Polarisedimenticolia bacterium]|nr:hypothetical protein [Candidatus Polarisedimenticolia bacterium]
MSRKPARRQREVGRISGYLRRFGSPRFHLLLVLLMTGAVGALVSALLLELGLSRMWVRYPVAALAAYASFLGLLRWWARAHIARPDVAAEIENAGAGNPAEAKSSITDGLSASDFLDLPLDLADAPVVLLAYGIIIVVIILILALAAAPVLLAEVLLDALLVAGLWRRLSRDRGAGTLRGAFRTTRVPAAIVIVCLGVIGLCIQTIDPSARSIGDLVRSRP